MSTDAPAINALAPWFGGKRTLAPRIVEAMRPHAAYWEPFAGSMAILLAKPPSRFETVSDLHGDLIHLARTLAHPTAGPALYRRLRRTLCSEALFREAIDKVRTDPAPGPDALDLDRAAAYFVVSWQGLNGVAGTRTTCTGYARRFNTAGGDPGKRWQGAVRSIPAWRRRLATVVVLQGDGFDLLARIEDNPDTVIYCDPPYIEKGADYLHDFGTGDHVRLAAALARFRRSQVLVSYYAHPDLSGLYPGWHFTALEANRNLRNPAGTAGRIRGGRAPAPEVLISNFSIAPSAPRGLFD